MEYLDEIEHQLSLIDWAGLDEETKQLIFDMGEQDELL